MVSGRQELPSNRSSCLRSFSRFSRASSILLQCSPSPTLLVGGADLGLDLHCQGVQVSQMKIRLRTKQAKYSARTLERMGEGETEKRM